MKIRNAMDEGSNAYELPAEHRAEPGKRDEKGKGLEPREVRIRAHKM